MIPFVPQRGQILMCDFDMAGVVPPEMRKKRRVAVISPRLTTAGMGCGRDDASWCRSPHPSQRW